MEKSKPLVYIAAPSPWIGLARQAEKEIEKKYPNRFNFSSDWYREGIEDGFDESTAKKDFCQVINSRIFFLLADVWRISTGGSEFELGLACSDPNKRIIVVGKKYNIFQMLPFVENYSTEEEAIAALSSSIE